jgi:predicted O-methyltransferase YrrM
MVSMGNLNWFFKYLIYKITSRHRRCFGLHSPFLYNFCDKVLKDKNKYSEKYAEIKKIVKKLERSSQHLPYSDYGSGSKINRRSLQSIKSIIRTSGIPQKYGKVLYNLIDYKKSSHILELGTSLGISTLYLAMHKHSPDVLTIEGSEERAQVAWNNFYNKGLTNVEVYIGNFTNNLDDILKSRENFDLVFIDGDHSESALLRNFYELQSHINEKSVIVLDDIHWSGSMERAWKKICDDENTTSTIDLFRLGIVFFDKRLSRQNLIINY